MASGSLPSESVEVLADALERRGLGAAAAILLDAHRPLLPLIRQGAIFIGPLLNAVVGPRSLLALREALDDPDMYDALAARLAGERQGDRP